MTDAEKSKVQLIQELTELRKRVQELDQSLGSLRRGETRYLEFVENIADSCFEMDLRGHFTFLNKTSNMVFGYPQEQAIGLSHRAYTSLETAENAFRVFSEIYRTGQPGTILNYEIIRPDGEKRYVDLSAALIRDEAGLPIGFRGIARDVTEFRQLFREQKRSKVFLDNVKEACWEIDLAGNTLFCNEAAWRMLGYTREEYLAPMYRQQVLSSEAYERIREEFNEVYRTGVPKTGVRTHVCHKDGSLRVIEMSITLVRDAEGLPSGFRGISRDVTAREKAETEEIRFRDFLENVEDCCFETDLRGGFTYFNEAQRKTLGFRADELASVNYRHYSSPAEAKKVAEAFGRTFRTGEPVTALLHEIVRKDGQTRVLEVSGTAIRDASGKITGFRGISRDVTERIKAQEELQRSREFLDNVAEGCVETDLEGRFIYLNDAYCRILGYPAEELRTMTYRDYCRPKEAERLTKLFRRMFKTGQPLVGLVREVVRKSGENRLIETSTTAMRDASGKIIGARSIAWDVTERKKAEAEQERYRVFLENIEDGCWEVNLAGDVTFCNQAMWRMLGYTREEFMKPGERKKRMSPDAHEEMLKMFSEMYRTGVPVAGRIFAYLHKDGSTRFLEMSISVMRNEAGKVIGARGVTRDVTEQRKIEEQLKQAQKLEAIGTLAGGIAHDFNNLLMGIQGYTSLMLLDIDPHHPHYERLRAIELQVKKAADLTKQLLGYARGGRYEVKATDMNRLIDQTANLFGRTKKELRIQNKFTENLWPVEVDQGQIDQALLNIFINAWQAMPGGGSLFLETSNVTLNEAYAKTYGVPAGPYVKISITDTGVGMDEKTRQRIFDPFFTTKGMGRGTGLGMASVYGIVRGHHGIIHVYSEKGHGTTFTIYLPSSQKEAELQQPALLKVAGGQKTILLADDEKYIADVTSAMLRGLGYNVLIAGGGEEAVEIYRSHQDKIDLVIMDMIMPGLGGGAAIDRIHALNPQARIILSSGYSLNGEAQEIMERGGPRAFLQKPFQINELAEKIIKIMAS